MHRQISPWPASQAHLRTGCLATVLITVLAALPLGAQTLREWNNIAGGNYFVGSSWVGGNAADTASEAARFNLAGTFAVSFNANGNTTIQDLTVNAGDVTFTNAGVYCRALGFVIREELKVKAH